MISSEKRDKDVYNMHTAMCVHIMASKYVQGKKAQLRVRNGVIN